MVKLAPPPFFPLRTSIQQPSNAYHLQVSIRTCICWLHRLDLARCRASCCLRFLARGLRSWSSAEELGVSRTDRKALCNAPFVVLLLLRSCSSVPEPQDAPTPSLPRAPSFDENDSVALIDRSTSAARSRPDDGRRGARLVPRDRRLKTALGAPLVQHHPEQLRFSPESCPDSLAAALKRLNRGSSLVEVVLSTVCPTSLGPNDANKTMVSGSRPPADDGPNGEGAVVERLRLLFLLSLRKLQLAFPITDRVMQVSPRNLAQKGVRDMLSLAAALGRTIVAHPWWESCFQRFAPTSFPLR
ncbi:hypothetical protein MIND_01154800 [Mycena indigotica]|uniref:Uncharacterized protein n=1 Tax=Mycena indigotica TaxID=2126181 RepID=A0A8H6S5G0_9AGAR|nr:uncharacterized protein MIND_01154800 [Mycena indigotica]KAF7292575.1 hypothetical protein MIND_01154800 [Mycena indigotica]